MMTMRNENNEVEFFYLDPENRNNSWKVICKNSGGMVLESQYRFEDDTVCAMASKAREGACEIFWSYGVDTYQKLTGSPLQKVKDEDCVQSEFGPMNGRMGKSYKNEDGNTVEIHGPKLY